MVGSDLLSKALARRSNVQTEQTVFFSIHYQHLCRERYAHNPQALAVLIATTLFKLLQPLHDSTSVQNEVVPTEPRPFLWHADAPELRLAPSRYPASPRGRTTAIDEATKSSTETLRQEEKLRLECYMRVRESTEDEWILLFLLLNLSANSCSSASTSATQEDEASFAIEILDSDGQLVLIEGADHLPAWLQPSSARNRLWIYRGQLHLVPSHIHSSAATAMIRRDLPCDDEASDDEADDDEAMGPHSSTQREDALRIEYPDALQAVFDPAVHTLASDALQNCIMQRVSKYPAGLHEQTHRVLAYLPHEILLALEVEPSLIQEALKTFLARGSAHLRSASRMSRFSPNTIDDARPYAVHLTRAAYAHLMSQPFSPPKIFQPQTWPTEPLQRQRREIGTKIAAAFEMLYGENSMQGGYEKASLAYQQKQSQYARECVSESEYAAYMHLLEGSGYFRKNQRDSTLYRDQLRAAQAIFEQVTQQASQVKRQPFATRVDQAICCANSELLQPIPTALAEDSVAWMTISPTNLDQLLGKVSDPTQYRADKGDVEMEDVGKLDDLSHKVTSLFERKGSLEGLQFEDDAGDSDDDDLGDIDENAQGFNEEDREMIDFEESLEASRSQRLSNLVPSVQPEAWGRQSQKPGTVHQSSTINAAFEDVEPSLASFHSKQPYFVPELFDGHVDSDDESDAEERATSDRVKELDSKDSSAKWLYSGDSDEAEDEKDDEPDFDEGDFLQFARKELGVSDDHWKSILEDRIARGSYVPESATISGHARSTELKPAQINEAKNTERPPSEERTATSKLDSFEKVMDALDYEVQKKRQSQAPANPQATSNMADDEELDMDEELAALLKRVPEDSDEEIDLSDLDGRRFHMLKNLVKSYDAQGGDSGPAGNILSRLSRD